MIIKRGEKKTKKKKKKKKGDDEKKKKRKRLQRPHNKIKYIGLQNNLLCT